MRPGLMILLSFLAVAGVIGVVSATMGRRLTTNLSNRSSRARCKVNRPIRKCPSGFHRHASRFRRRPSKFRR